MYYVLCAATIVKYGGKGLNIYILFIFRICSGLILTRYSRFDPDNSFKEKLSLAINEYNNHKKIFALSEKFKGFIRK